MGGIVLTRDEIDRALAQVEADSERIAESLVEMDAHPGHRLLRDTALSGVTAQRWAEARTAMETLWEQYTTYGALVSRAREVRSRRSKPGDEEIEELTHILGGPVVELDSEAIPIERRGLTGPAQVTERITMAELLSRMRQAFDMVTGVLAAAESAWSNAIGRLDPLDKRMRDVSILAESVGEGDFASLKADLDTARELVLTDMLAPRTGDAIPEIERRLTELEARLREYARVRDGFATRLTALQGVLSDVEAAEATARQTYDTVLDKIASPGLAEPTDQGSSALRGRLQRLRSRMDTAGWATLARETDELDRFAASTLDAARMSLRAMTGLLDRRAELRGRLEAYEVKAARLGHAEDDDLSRLHDEAHEILFTAPCDLPAATRALNRYRQTIQDRTQPHKEGTQ